MKHLTRPLLMIVAVMAFGGVTAAPLRASGVSVDQLTQAGWTCVQPLLDPTREICAPPGQG